MMSSLASIMSNNIIVTNDTCSDHCCHVALHISETSKGKSSAVLATAGAGSVWLLDGNASVVMMLDRNVSVIMMLDA